MDIIINVIDMNDNKPVFPPEPFRGNVPEASSTGEHTVYTSLSHSEHVSESEAKTGCWEKAANLIYFLSHSHTQALSS